MYCRCILVIVQVLIFLFLFLFYSEQPVKIQILLTDAQEEVVDSLSEASLGPPLPSHIIPHSPAPSTSDLSHSYFRESPERPPSADNRQHQHTRSNSQERPPASAYTTCKPGAGSVSRPTVNGAAQVPSSARDRPDAHNHHPPMSRSFSVPRSSTSSDPYSSEEKPQMLHSQKSPQRPDTTPHTHSSMSSFPSSPCLLPRSTSPARPMPVERWAENVTKYYNSQTASQQCDSSCEESELDSLYRASLRAPSKPRGSCGPSPHPTGRQGIDLPHEK